VQIQQLHVVTKLLSCGNCNTKFPVCLAVKLVSPDETCARSVARAQKDHVSWYALILLQQDEVARFEGRGRDRACMWTAVRGGDESEVFLGVRFAVTEIALVVVVGFFTHCDAEHEGQWCNICNN